VSEEPDYTYFEETPAGMAEAEQVACEIRDGFRHTVEAHPPMMPVGQRRLIIEVIDKLNAMEVSSFLSAAAIINEMALADMGRLRDAE